MLKTYLPGDSVKLGPLKFTHEMRIERVFATFEHVSDSSSVIRLRGTPNPAVRKRVMHSEVSLMATVSEDDAPGEYKCHYLKALTFGGKALRFEDPPGGPMNLELHLEKEP